MVFQFRRSLAILAFLAICLPARCRLSLRESFVTPAHAHVATAALGGVFLLLICVHQRKSAAKWFSNFGDLWQSWHFWQFASPLDAVSPCESLLLHQPMLIWHRRPRRCVFAFDLRSSAQISGKWFSNFGDLWQSWHFWQFASLPSRIIPIHPNLAWVCPNWRLPPASPARSLISLLPIRVLPHWSAVNVFPALSSLCPLCPLW